MGLKLKSFFTPKGIAGLIAAPFTGGASLALTAKSAMDEQKKEEKKKQAEQIALDEQRRRSEESERKTIKMQDLEERNKRASGLSSLIGSGTTFG